MADRNTKTELRPLRFQRPKTEARRTKSGLEVDFVLADGEMALEVKGAGRVANKDLKALAAFADEFQPKHAILICNEKAERLVGRVRVVPWKVFLTRLWAGHYLK